MINVAVRLRWSFFQSDAIPMFFGHMFTIVVDVFDVLIIHDFWLVFLIF